MVEELRLVSIIIYGRITQCSATKHRTTNTFRSIKTSRKTPVTQELAASNSCFILPQVRKFRRRVGKIAVRCDALRYGMLMMETRLYCLFGHQSIFLGTRGPSLIAFDDLLSVPLVVRQALKHMHIRLLDQATGTVLHSFMYVSCIGETFSACTIINHFTSATIMHWKYCVPLVYMVLRGAWRVWDS